MLVATLIAPAPDRRLASIAAAAGSVLRAEGPVWLAADTACDLVFDQGEPAAATAAVRTLLGDAVIDVVVQPARGRRKRLLVADLESTIIENEMLDELGDMLGVGAEVAGITRRAMNGEIDFAAALTARAALFAGADAGILAAAAGRIRMTGGARRLVATMRRDGAVTALVTGGFAAFAEPVGTALGFDHIRANRLEIADGHLTGRIDPPLITGQSKRTALLTLAAQYGVACEETVAVGDGANDIAMLRTAGLGVAFHPKPVVAADVHTRLDHADLTGLLYAQGYCEDEFAAVGAAPQL